MGLRYNVFEQLQINRSIMCNSFCFAGIAMPDIDGSSKAPPGQDHAFRRCHASSIVQVNMDIIRKSQKVSAKQAHCHYRFLQPWASTQTQWISGFGGRIAAIIWWESIAALSTCAKTCRIEVCCRKPNGTSKWDTYHIPIWKCWYSYIFPLSAPIYIWHLYQPAPPIYMGIGIQQVLSHRLRFIYMAIYIQYIYIYICDIDVIHEYIYIYILRIFLETMSFKL